MFWPRAPRSGSICDMVDVAAGLVLIVGGGVAAAALIMRPGGRLASAAMAAALVAAGIARFLEDSAATELTFGACVLAVAGLVLLVLVRSESVSKLSWLDAAMAASAAGALSVSLGGAASPAVAAAGAVGGLALSRWRPGWAAPVAIVGLVALADGALLAPVAALGLAG